MAVLLNPGSGIMRTSISAPPPLPIAGGRAFCLLPNPPEDRKYLGESIWADLGMVLHAASMWRNSSDSCGCAPESCQCLVVSPVVVVLLYHCMI